MGEIDSYQGAQRLADVLKRCGMATNVRDAQRMADEIAVTEKKVQTYFDIKKEQIHEEMIKRVHGETRAAAVELNISKITDEERPKIEPAVHEVAEENSEKNPKVEVYYDHHEDHDPNSGDYINMLIPPTEEREEKVNLSVEENQDYIMIQDKEAKLEDEPKIEVIHHEPAEEKEEDFIHLDKMEEKIEERIAERLNDARSETKAENLSSSLGIVSDTHHESHPKTGNTQSVDINEFFNFGKKDL